MQQTRAEGIEVPDKPQHWSADQQNRDRLTRTRDRLGLDNHELLLALGGAPGVSQYGGTLEEAIQDIRDYARGKTQKLLDGLNPSPPTHGEAQAIAWTSIKIGKYAVNITARQGASAQTVAATTVALVGAIDILEELGVITTH